MRGRGKRRKIEEDTETVKIIEEWQEENIRRYREKDRDKNGRRNHTKYLEKLEGRC